MSGAVCLVYGCATEEDEENNGYVLRCTGVNDENPTGATVNESKSRDDL